MTRLSGTVRATVEAGGLLLDAGGTSYLLLGGAAAGLRPGDVVEVAGELADVVTVFQQGVPFRVSEVLHRGG